MGMGRLIGRSLWGSVCSELGGVLRGGLGFDYGLGLLFVWHRYLIGVFKGNGNWGAAMRYG